MKTQGVKKMQYLYSCILMVFLLTLSSPSWAQKRTITGIVTDETNEPVIGANVVIKNTTIGTITGIDGQYRIEAPDNATLVFSFIGYNSIEEKVNGRTQINVSMKSNDITLSDVVVVGYGVQKKVSLTGAIAGVRSTDLLKTKNENPQNMLTGKISGVRVWQKSAEPGSYSNNFDIRGYDAPLVIIDGVPRDVQDFQRLNANDIDDISVLKDASAAIYGVRSANGVILVTTKKGSKEGKTKVSYNGSFTIQQPSDMPKLSDPYGTMILYNEKAMNKVDGGNIIYGEDQFEAFRNGSRRATDWNSLIFSDHSPQTQHDISISGGNERTQYYIGMGYFYQEGFFKSGDLNYEKYNIRSNISTRILKGLTFELNLSAFLDERNSPYYSSVDIIRNYWSQGVLYPAYADPENTMLNYKGLELENNTVAFMTSDVSGYKKNKQKNIQSSASLNYDFGTITPVLKGLSAKALFSYDYRLGNNESYRKEYYQYAYDDLTDTYTQKLYNNSSPSNLLRKMYDKQQTLAQLILNYNRTFGEHSISGLIGWETQKRQGDNFYAQRNLAFSVPYLFVGEDTAQQGGMYSGNSDLYEEANSALIGRINYAYGSRYLLEAQFRYDGSSKFAKGHKWGFFPSVAVGWNVSQENFFEPLKDVISNLKLRASYGLVGNDQLLDSSGGLIRFIYMSDITLQSENAGFTTGDKQQITLNGPVYTRYQNNDLTWEVGEKLNVGFDMQLFNSLNVTVDAFREIRRDIFQQRYSIPNYLGTASTAVYGNLAKVKNYGFDLSLDYGKQINKDLAIQFKGTFTFARNEILEYDEAPGVRPSLSNIGKKLNTIYGYVTDGLYIDQADIANSPSSTLGNIAIAPGDIKYVDQPDRDGVYDGKITSDDRVAMGYPTVPEIVYGFGPSISYKNWDFSFFFQGVANTSLMMSGFAPFGTQYNRNVLSWIADDYWSPSNQNPNAAYPRLTKNDNNHNTQSSDYWLRNGAFLKLKNAEIGYTWKKVRFYISGANLLTFSPFDLWDPEMGGGKGLSYPTQRTFNLGLQLSFK